MDLFHVDPLSNQNTATNTASNYNTVGDYNWRDTHMTVADAKNPAANIDTKNTTQPSTFSMLSGIFNIIKNGDYTSNISYYTTDYQNSVAWCPMEELTEYSITRLRGSLRNLPTKVTGIVLVYRVDDIPSYSIAERDAQNVLLTEKVPTQYAISKVMWLVIGDNYVPTITLYTDKATVDDVGKDEKYFCLQFITALKDTAPRDELIKLGEQFNSYSTLLKKKADKTRHTALDAVKQIVALEKFIESPSIEEIDAHMENNRPKKQAHQERTRKNMRPDNLACSPCYVQDYEFPTPQYEPVNAYCSKFWQSRTPYSMPSHSATYDVKQGEREVKYKDVMQNAALPTSLVAAYSDMKYSDIWTERYKYGTQTKSTNVTNSVSENNNIPLKDIFKIMLEAIPKTMISVVLKNIRLFLDMEWDSIEKVVAADSKCFDIVAYKNGDTYTLQLIKYLNKETEDLMVEICIDGQKLYTPLNAKTLGNFRMVWRECQAADDSQAADSQAADSQAADSQAADIKEQLNASKEPVEVILKFLEKKCSFISATRRLLEAQWETVYVDTDHNIVANNGKLCVTINSGLFISGRISQGNLSVRIENGAQPEFQLMSYGLVKKIMDMIHAQTNAVDNLPKEIAAPTVTSANIPDDCKYPLIWNFLCQLRISSEEFIYIEQILDLGWYQVALEELNIIFYIDINRRFGYLNTADIVKEQLDASRKFIVYNSGRVMAASAYSITNDTVNLIRRSLLCEVAPVAMYDTCNTLDDVRKRLALAFYPGTGAVEQVMHRIDRLLNNYEWTNWKIMPNGSIMFKNPHGTFTLCVAQLGKLQSSGISELVLNFHDKTNVLRSESFFDTIFQRYVDVLVWKDIVGDVNTTTASLI